MKHLRNNWRAFILLSLFLGLALFFRTFLIMNVFEPIAVLFWAAWRIVSSVHQNIYWTILIVICLILMIRVIPFRKNASGPAYGDEHPLPNRVEDWLRLMKNASLGMDETDYLRDSLKRLLISIDQLDGFHTMKPDETAMLEAGLLPETVHRFLFPAKGIRNMFSGDHRLQVLSLTPKWFRRWASKVFQIDNPAIEETLAWMESLMEINNDQKHRDESID